MIARRISIFLLCLLAVGVLGIFAWNQSFVCAFSYDHLFDCRVIAPLFNFSSIALFFLSFFIPQAILADWPKRKLLIMIFFITLAVPLLSLGLYSSLSKEKQYAYFEGVSLSACEKKSSQDIRVGDRCFSTLATVLWDARICDRIQERSEREECYFSDTGYGSRGAYKENLIQSDCNSLSNEFQRESCNNYFTAKDAGKSGKCEIITDGFDRWFCWGNVARKESTSSFNPGDIDFRENYKVNYNPEDCAELSNYYVKDYCYFKYVKSLNETPNSGELNGVEQCGNIINAIMRQDCEAGWYKVSGQVK